MYYDARYYDPELRRFTSVDPPLIHMLVPTHSGLAPNLERLVYPQKANLYTYVENNPIRYNDPTGEEAVDWFDIFLAVVTLGFLGGAQQVGDDADPGYTSVEGAALDLVSQDVYENSDLIQGGVYFMGALLSKGRNQTKTIDQAIEDVIDFAEKRNGMAQPGYRGGATFQNDGRGGGQRLADFDGNGDPINYKEYDIYPSQPGQRRGEERLVIGSDGRVHYTDDHYDNFIDITDYYE